MQARKPQVVVVTGASAGVGRATVREFARVGAHIGLLARDPERLKRTSEEVKRIGGEAIALPTDVAGPAQVDSALHAVEDRFCPIDIWVNNASATVYSPVVQLQPEEIRRVTEVAYLGAVYGTLAALRSMIPRNCGIIVQVGSALAYRSIPLQSAYCGAKHALAGFTEALRCELLHEKSQVQVTMVQLPALNTPQFEWGRSRLPRQPQPVPPIYQPELAARAILWAAQHPRREVKVATSSLLAIYGERLLPGLLDHYVARTGYESQQTPHPADCNHPDNLFAPVPGDYGAHGIFDRQSRRRSWQWWVNSHRWESATAILAGATLLWKTLQRE